MEKISSILPATARITSVDLKESSPLRRGQPGFGQRIAEQRISSAPKLTVIEAPKAYEKLSVRKMKDRENAELVKNMSNEFFMKHKPQAIEEELTENFNNPIGYESPFAIKFESELPNQSDYRLSNDDDYSFEVDPQMYEAVSNIEVEPEMRFNEVGKNLNIIA